MVDCAKAVTTEELDRQVEIDNIKTALRQCDYLNWAFKAVEKKMREEKTKKKKKDERKENTVVIIRQVVIPTVCKRTIRNHC